MARCWALCAVALAVCAQPGVASSTKLRGHHVHKHHHRKGAPVKHAKVSKHQAKSDPLYDDFLALMHHATGKALKEQKGVPAYDDFLHLMKNSADKAYKEQVSETQAPAYDKFLKIMKTETTKAYHQQVELPSYDDFLTALKESSNTALKKPDPSFDDFLNTLKAGSEMAMQKRVFHDLKADTIKALSSHKHSVGKKMNKTNPLDKVRGAMRGDGTKHSREKKKSDDEDHALRDELRRLKAKQAQHVADGKTAPKKPIMKRINVLRTQLCWKRPNLWKHEKCMRFLGLHCMEESTGEGICKDFTKKAQEKCKTSTDPHWKEDYCALGEALGDREGQEDGEEVVEDENDADTDADANGHKVGSDEDLDDANAEEEKKLEEGTGDRDGDGVMDKDDAFADDASESKDTDGDGIGDNKDKDIDGDNVTNKLDVFPEDKTEWADSDHDTIGDNADKDSDNDNIPNDKDKFPADPNEWSDSDGDGIGDNRDAYPYNPNCHSATEPCHNLTKIGAPKPGSPEDPTTLDMSAKRALPEQGYNEAMTGPPVNHDNYYTWVSDWQDEWPEMEETEKQTLARICKGHSTNVWCVRFKNADAHFR